MINIVTVHWQSARWIDVQLRYLERHVPAPFRVFASLNGIEDASVWPRFFFAEDLEGSHPAKLNALADVVAASADPSDPLVFLDGDAFPVQPLVPWLDDVLARHPLVAVRRDENLGDLQPHPSFCATTVGFWRELGGDWRGGSWINEAGREVRDAGGRLMALLSEREVDWLPLLRTNTANPHPLWFGVYAHRIYHHGGGFQQTRVERVDWAERYRRHAPSGRSLRPTEDSPSVGLLLQKLRSDPASLGRLRPRHVAVAARATIKTGRLRREHRYYLRHLRSEQGRSLEVLEQDVFAELSRNPDFFLRFDDLGGDDEPTTSRSGSGPR